MAVIFYILKELWEHHQTSVFLPIRGKLGQGEMCFIQK